MSTDDSIQPNILPIREIGKYEAARFQQFFNQESLKQARSSEIGETS